MHNADYLNEAHCSRRRSSSMRGIKKASVFPDPVHACIQIRPERMPLSLTQVTNRVIFHTSTATSLWVRNSGIVVACTGVIRVKPDAAKAIGGWIVVRSEGKTQSGARQKKYVY